jgi:hypothetical protein
MLLLCSATKSDYQITTHCANFFAVEAVEKANFKGICLRPCTGYDAAMDPEEIPEFSNKMKEAGETNMMRVSLIISILAALVATVTVLGHREHTEAILLQAQAGDQWQQYQSRKVRSQQVEDSIVLLSLQPANDSAAVQKQLASWKVNLDKWQDQLAEEMKKAKELGAEVKVAEGRAGRFDLGEALLQIAVVLASITLLTRHQRYVVVGCLLGTAGIAITASAYLLH